MYTFVLSLFCLIAAALPLYAQIDKSSGADVLMRDDIVGLRWSMQVNLNTGQRAYLKFLRRDSLISVFADNKIRVVNYYSGKVLQTIKNPFSSNKALQSNSRYMLKVEPSEERAASILAYFEYFKRLDMDNDFRLDTFAFETNSHAPSHTVYTFQEVKPVPRDEHRYIIKIHRSYYHDGYSVESGNLLLFDDRKPIPTDAGVDVGANAKFVISPDGKYCVSGGITTTHDRIASYKDHYIIWRITDNGLELVQKLSNFVDVQFDPWSRFILLWSEGNFVQRYLLDPDAQSWRSVDAFNLTRHGLIDPAGSNYVRFDYENSHLETIRLANGQIKAQCNQGGYSGNIKSLRLSPLGDIVILTNDSGKIFALNFCGTSPPPRPSDETEESEDIPQFRPRVNGKRSFASAVHRIENLDRRACRLTVYNLTGRPVYQAELDGEAELQLPTSDWPRGVYFVVQHYDRTVKQSCILITD